jgi:transcriptional regulator with XRE-family HTH domain
MVRLPLTPAEVERGQRLGALLRRARGERSMLETALDARVSPETLRKIESGRVATPAFPTIAAIAEVLGLSLDAVWAEINQPEHAGEPTGSVAAHVSGGLAGPDPAAASTRERTWARLPANAPDQYT